MKFAVSTTVGTVFLFCTGSLAHAGEDYFDLSLKELSTITVTSVFPENYLTATSSVSVVNADFWQLQGARRPADVMAALPSTMTYPSLGAHGVSMRGFAHNTSAARGIATLIDGVPLNGYGFGSALYARFQWDLDSLSQLQVIRGPSSALYGSDAFHGVIAMRSFASDTDLQRVSASLGSDRYWHTSWNASTGVGNGWRLNSSVGLAENPVKTASTTSPTPLPARRRTAITRIATTRKTSSRGCNRHRPMPSATTLASTATATTPTTIPASASRFRPASVVPAHATLPTATRLSTWAGPA